MTGEQRILRLLCTEKTPDERAICKAAFRAILAGEALDRAGLRRATSFPEERVDALLDGLARRGLIAVEPGGGRVIGSWGLSLVPTNHRLRIRGRELYTWCAVDAVGIPAGLSEDAKITSRCAQCDASVNIEMVAGRVSRVAPRDVRVWVAATQAGRPVVGFT